MASQELKDLSIANSPEPVTMETAQATLDRAKTIQLPEVTGAELSSEPKTVSLKDTFKAPPAPVTPAAVGGITTALSEDRKARDLAHSQAQDQQGLVNALGGESSIDIYNQLLERQGVTPERLSELEDIELQLADMSTSSEITKSRISGAAGQTLGQAQREVTQENREQAIRSAGLSARAAVMRGNIDTARSLVKDMMVQVNADRSTKLAISMKQLDRLYDVADDKDKVLLDQKKAEVEEEQRQIERVEEAVDAATTSGSMTQQEMDVFADSEVSDEDKLALAQSIVGRGATEERALSNQAKNASIRSSNASAALNEQKLVDIEAKTAMLDEAIASGQVILSDEQADRASKIAKEFESEAGEFKKSVASYNRIIASAEDPSAAGDVAVVFNFMKMLDPGSVVRESEFALAASTGSLDEAIKNKFGKYATGEILEFTRDDFVDRASKIYFGQLDQQIELEERFRKQAVDLYGLPENSAELIVQDIRSKGSVSDASFSLMLDTADTAQLQELSNLGLLPNSTPQR